MHIILGFLNIISAHYLTSLFLAVRRDFIGRMAVRRCCAGFSAGAGLDDGAVEELLRMGRPDALRFLQHEADLTGEHSVAGLMLKMLASLPADCSSVY